MLTPWGQHNGVSSPNLDTCQVVRPQARLLSLLGPGFLTWRTAKTDEQKNKQANVKKKDFYLVILKGGFFSDFPAGSLGTTWEVC